MTIFITGYMASGKTTFGRALARKTGMDFIDLDFYIEQRFRMSVKEIFASKGEAEFRRIESEMLREAGEFENTVVSCGGGTPCFGDNMDWMNSRGLTVALEASEDVIADRVIRAGDKRPLMAGKDRGEVIDTIREHLAVRGPFYKKAKVTVSADRLEDRLQISETVDSFLKKHLYNLE